MNPEIQAAAVVVGMTAFAVGTVLFGDLATTWARQTKERMKADHDLRMTEIKKEQAAVAKTARWTNL